jgi:WD40 repeat protein
MEQCLQLSRFVAQTRVNAFVMTPAVVRFLKGRIADGSHRVATIHNSGCHLFHEHGLIYVCYDAGLGAHRLVRCDRSESTGSFERPTSIAVGGERVWVAGDIRVRAFTLSDFKPCDTLHVRDDIVWESSMAVWCDHVVLGTGSDIFTWCLNEPRESVQQQAIVMEGSDVCAGLNPREIDWTRGRPPTQTLKLKNELRRVTAVCAAGNYLAVGSCDYAVIHIFGDSRDGVVSLRLIGHRLGVTGLLLSGNLLLSGSADKSTMIWNLYERGGVVFTLEGHKEAVSALAIGKFDKELFGFSGDLDGTVHAWHLTRKKPALQIDVGEGWYAAGLDFDDETGTLQMVARRKDDLEVEYEADRTKLVAQIQTFRFAL